MASSPPHLQMPLISTTMAANSDYHFVILLPSAIIFSPFLSGLSSLTITAGAGD